MPLQVFVHLTHHVFGLIVNPGEHYLLVNKKVMMFIDVQFTLIPI